MLKKHFRNFEYVHTLKDTAFFYNLCNFPKPKTFFTSFFFYPFKRHSSCSTPKLLSYFSFQILDLFELNCKTRVYLRMHKCPWKDRFKCVHNNNCASFIIIKEEILALRSKLEQVQRDKEQLVEHNQKLECRVRKNDNKNVYKYLNHPLFGIQVKEINCELSNERSVCKSTIQSLENEKTQKGKLEKINKSLVVNNSLNCV